MTEEAMRKDFEAACIKRWFGSDRGATVIRADGKYENGNVQFGWVCWQGATRAAAPAWLPIAGAPMDGTEVLVWREDCGQFIASYTNPAAMPLTQDELDEMSEESLFAHDWFTKWPNKRRLEGSEVPTLYMPLPPAPEAKP